MVGISSLSLLLLAPPAPLVRSAPFIIRGQDTKHERQRRPARPDDVAIQVGQPEAHVPQGIRAPEGHEVPIVEARLHAALQRDLGEDVVAQVAQHSAGVGQLGAAQVDLVVCHHTDELKPPETKLGPSMWSTLKGFVGEAGGVAG